MEKSKRKLIFLSIFLILIISTFVSALEKTEISTKQEIQQNNEESTKSVISIEYGAEKTRDVTIQSEGEKKTISVSGATERDCDEYKTECELGDKILCIKWQVNCQKEEITAETKEEVKIENNKIYVNEKEIKIMPDTASEKARETLQIKEEVRIELKDTEKPMYEIEGIKEGKILGLINVEIPVKIEINAETGDVENIDKPWWSFLVGEKEALDEIGGATGRDCEEYLEGCNSGDEVLCIKWETNCQEKNESNNNFGNCKPVVYKGNPTEKINFVFVSTGEISDEEIFASGLFNQSADYSFYSIYPYNENKDEFNFFYLDSPIENITLEQIKYKLKDECGELAENIYQIIGTGNIGGIAHNYLNTIEKIGYQTVPYNSDKPYTSYLHLFLHEIGHSFGGLDEGYGKAFFSDGYSYPASFYKDNYDNNTNLPPNWDIEGCPKWCSGQINTSSICYDDYLIYKTCVLSSETVTSGDAQTCANNFNDALSNKGIELFPHQCNFGIGCMRDTNCWLIGMPFFRAYDEDIMYSSANIPYEEIFNRGYGPSGGVQIEQTIELIKRWNNQKQNIEHINFEVIDSSLTALDDTKYEAYIKFKLTDSNNINILMFTDKILDDTFIVKSKKLTETEYFRVGAPKKNMNGSYEIRLLNYFDEKNPTMHPLDFKFEIRLSNFEEQWNYSLTTD